MRNLRKTVSLIIVLVALAAALTLVVPTPAAADRCGSEFTYYSDDTHAEVVGVRGWMPYECNCQLYGWGSVTSYREIGDSWCG